MSRLEKADPDRLSKMLTLNAEVASAYTQGIEKLLDQIEGKNTARAFKNITAESTYPCSFIYSAKSEYIYSTLAPDMERYFRKNYGDDGLGTVRRIIGTIHIFKDGVDTTLRKAFLDWDEYAKNCKKLSEPAYVAWIAKKHDEALVILKELEELKIPYSITNNRDILPILST